MQALRSTVGTLPWMPGSLVKFIDAVRFRMFLLRLRFERNTARQNYLINKEVREWLK